MRLWDFNLELIGDLFGHQAPAPLSKFIDCNLPVAMAFWMSVAYFARNRRVGRVVEGNRLKSGTARNRREGSNPSPYEEASLSTTSGDASNLTAFPLAMLSLAFDEREPG